jgi:hypothetical protein
MVPTWFLSLIYVLADTQTRQISPQNQKVFSHYIQFCYIRLFANIATYYSQHNSWFNISVLLPPSLGCQKIARIQPEHAAGHVANIMTVVLPVQLFGFDLQIVHVKKHYYSSQLASWLLTDLNNLIYVKCILS